ncbi:MAG: glycosyltransferase [Spirochaetota bacterium]|nr:glycosyltransferase [Spirochaetota bacterium]
MISIIIPTLRITEEEIIRQLESLILQNRECELIFSHGEYQGFQIHIQTISDMLADTNISFKVIQNPQTHTILSRAESMNLAAEKASGDILLFLHLDCFLPPHALHSIDVTMKNPNYIAGGFLKRYDRAFFCRLTEKVLNYRSKTAKRLVGTNAIFVRKSVFKDKPFPNQFMEDVAFSDNLLENYSKTSIVIIDDPVIVSAVKYGQNNGWKRILINACVMILHRVYKVRHEELEKLYKSGNKKSISALVKESCRLKKS